jgi:hypothetical protein
MWLFDIDDKTDKSKKKALSFLSPEEVNEIGELKGEAIIGFIKNDSLAPEDFILNNLFINFMHRVIAINAPSDMAIQSAAIKQKEGWIYIIDNRASEHIYPEDIIGAFKVNAGIIISDSYSQNGKYSILTEKGVSQLSPFIIKSLTEEIKSQ